jgi:hypothetical protein
VHIAARVAATAEPDEVLVSSTVRDLVAGSGLRFADRGVHALKGVPGEWRLLSFSKAGGFATRGPDDTRHAAALVLVGRYPVLRATAFRFSDFSIQFRWASRGVAPSYRSCTRLSKFRSACDLTPVSATIQRDCRPLPPSAPPR